MGSVSDTHTHWDDWRLWSTLLVLHLPALLVPSIYWRFRDIDPIKSRRPRLLTVSCIALTIIPLHQISRNLFRESIPSWWDVILAPAILLIPIESFFIFSISLYVAFNKTRDQLNLFLNRGYATLEFEQARASIARKNLLLTDTFAMVWIGVNVLLIQAVILIYAASVDFSALTLSIEDIADGWALPYCQYIIVGRMLITVMMFVAVTFKLRIVEDAFGSKRMLRQAGMGAAVGALLYLLIGESARQLAVVLTCDWILFQAFILPIRRIQQHGGRTRDQTRSEGGSQFERFLQTETGFAAFRDHLEKEFAVESLLFWRDVQKFRLQFASSADGGCQAAMTICNRYLCPQAPLEVNLSGSTKASIIAEFRDGVLHASMFDGAAQHILLLMESNSLLRFLKTSPPSWEQFIVGNRADYLMTDQGGAGMCKENSVSLLSNSGAKVNVTMHQYQVEGMRSPMEN